MPGSPIGRPRYATWEEKLLQRPTTRSCVVSMFDLLGYGTMLTAASARLDHPVTALAVERIHQFHRSPLLLKRPSGVSIHQLNDAIIAVRDLSDNGAPPIRLDDDPYHEFQYGADGAAEAWEFLRWVRDVHDEVRTQQRADGYPGARTIVVFDRRLAVEPDSPLNLNMAFALAYKADAAGSAAGLEGDQLYIHLPPYDLIATTLNVSNAVPGPPIALRILGRAMEFVRCPRVLRPGTRILESMFVDCAMTNIGGERPSSDKP